MNFGEGVRDLEQSLFGMKLRSLREERGMTLNELSIKSGIHESTISRLENDPGRRPQIETFVHLARGLGVSLQELALLTEVIDPAAENSLIIEDQFLVNNFHLFNKQNLLLLKELEGIDQDTKNYLLKFITGLKKELPISS